MMESLLCGKAVLGIENQQVTDEILGLVRNVIPPRAVKLIFACHNLLEKLDVVLVVKGLKKMVVEFSEL